MRGAPLLRDQVVQVCQPRQKRLVAAAWMVKRFHPKQFPVNGIMRLIPQGAGDRHLRVCEDRIPLRFLGLKPLAHARPMGLPSEVGDVIGKAASPLAQGKHPQVLALARSVPQGVQLGA